MDLEYEQMGDYLIPKLKANPEPEGMVTKYGLLRDKFLRERYDGARTAMFLEGTLKAHLLEIQEQARERMEVLTSQMAEKEGVNEQLKAQDQMLWVKKMNSIQSGVLHQLADANGELLAVSRCRNRSCGGGSHGRSSCGGSGRTATGRQSGGGTAGSGGSQERTTSDLTHFDFSPLYIAVRAATGCRTRTAEL